MPHFSPGATPAVGVNLRPTAMGNLGSATTNALPKAIAVRETNETTSDSGAATTKGVGTEEIGRGCLGTVLYPPPPCLDCGVGAAEQRRAQQYVMKIGRRAPALHAVSVAQHIRRRWATICRLPRVPGKAPLETGLRREWARLGPDAFFALPLDRMCGRWPNRPDGDLVGTYMPHAGRPWPARFPQTAAIGNGQKRYAPTDVATTTTTGVTAEGLKMARHLVLGLLAMHRCGVTHNDLHPHNLLLKAEGQGFDVPRWCDFDNAVLERDEDGDGVVCDALPPDSRIYTAMMDSCVHVFLYGRWIRCRPIHVARDWNDLRTLLSRTWPVDHKAPDRRWARAIAALEGTTDRSARLAYLILSHAVHSPSHP